MPVISVVIPAYNRAALLRRAVDSVRLQNFDDLEILIVDDGSADNTAEVVAGLQRDEPRIRYIRHPVNRGEAAARNTGIAAAKGSFVAFLDSDDEWLPGKIAGQLAALQEHAADVAAVSAMYVLVDETGEVPVTGLVEKNPVTKLELLTRGCGLSLGNTLVVRREVFADIGYFDETLRLFVDLDWLCRLTAKYRLIVVDQLYARYHKAPMRHGHVIEAAAKAYLEKNRIRDLLPYSWHQRCRINSQFYRYISSGYEANGNWSGFVRTRALMLLWNPFQSLKEYLKLLLVLLRIVRLGPSQRA